MHDESQERRTESPAFRQLMNEGIARQSINKICASFRQRYQNDVSDISAKEEEKEFLIQFKIGDAIDGTWKFNKENNFILTRIDAATTGMSEDDVIELRSEIMEHMDPGAAAPLVGNKITVQQFFSVIPEGEKEPDEEQMIRRIFDESMKFYLIFIRMKDRFTQQKEEISSSTALDYSLEDEDKDDPFGFNSVLPDIDMFDMNETSPSQPSAETDADNTGSGEPSETNDEDILNLGTPDQKTSATASALQNTASRKRRRKKKTRRASAPASSAASVEEDDDVYAMLDSLTADVSQMGYDPNAIKPTEDDDEDILSVLEAEDEGTNDLTQSAANIRSSLNDVFNTFIPQARELAMKSADEFSELATNVSVREQEVHAREVLLQKRQEEWQERNEKLKQKEQQISEISEKYDQISTESKEKDKKIRQLSDDLVSVTHKAEDAEKRLQEMTEEQTSGTAGQAYLKQLRQKLAYREDFIKDLQKKLDTSIEISEKLRDRMQKSDQSASEAVLNARAEWAAKEKDYQHQIEELENQGASGGADPEELHQLREQLSDAEKQISDLNDEKNLLHLRVEAAQNDRDRLSEELNASQEETEQLRMKEDVSAIAAEVRDDLVRMSDHEFEPLPGESEMIIHGNYGSDSDICRISFDAKERILYITHPVSRVRRVEDQVEELNQQDIRTAYDLARDESTGQVTVTCKAFCYDYHKAAKLALDVVNKMLLIND